MTGLNKMMLAAIAAIVVAGLSAGTTGASAKGPGRSLTPRAMPTMPNLIPNTRPDRRLPGLSPDARRLRVGPHCLPRRRGDQWYLIC
jgi:hypothetical protein